MVVDWAVLMADHSGRCLVVGSAARKDVMMAACSECQMAGCLAAWMAASMVDVKDDQSVDSLTRQWDAKKVE